MKSVNSYEGSYNPETEAKKRQYKKSIRPLLFYPLIDLILASVSNFNRHKHLWLQKHIYELKFVNLFEFMKYKL